MEIGQKLRKKPGANTFSWHFTASHSTLDWRYFITKTGWDPSRPLDRAAFEETRFCTYQGNYQRPPADIAHRCVVPDRSGYHRCPPGKREARGG